MLYLFKSALFKEGVSQQVTGVPAVPGMTTYITTCTISGEPRQCYPLYVYPTCICTPRVINYTACNQPCLLLR